MQTEAKSRMQNRLKRVAGQVAGLQRMVEEDRYCMDILTQIAALRSALDAAGVEALTGHVESCVLGHGTLTEHDCARPRTQQELLEEVRLALRRFLKS